MSSQEHIVDDLMDFPKKASNPIRLLIILTVTVFVMEFIIMIGIEFFVSPESSMVLNLVEAVFDATLLTIVVFPMLYWFSFRPLVLYINEHRKIEQDLETSNALLENTFASLSDVVLVVNMPEYSILTCNQAVQTVLGYECYELTGQSLQSLYTDPEAYADFLQAADDVFKNGRFYQNEQQVRRKDGRLIYADMTVTQINNDAGDAISEVIVIRDLTRRKRDKAQLERHNQELLTLSRLGQTVVASLELDAVLTHVIDQVMPFLNADCFSILLLEGSELVNYAIGGIGTQTLQGLRIPTSTESVSKVLEDSEPMLIDCENDMCAFSSLAEATLCNHTPHTLMIAPLKVGNETIGLIQAANETPDSFSPNDLKMLQAAANWAAIAISHARKHEEIQRRLQETATLAAVNQSLNETLDLDDILQLIADSTPTLLHNVDRVVIHLLEEDGNELYPVIWSGQASENAPRQMFAKEGVAGYALETGKLINVPNVNDDPHYLSYSPSVQFKSLMVAPLQSSTNQLGTISVYCILKNSAFSSTDEQLLTRFAHSAAIAISTTKLHEAERHQRQFAERLAQAAAALSLSLNVKEVIQTILTQTLLIVTKSERVDIFLLKKDDVYYAQSTNVPELLQQLPKNMHHIFAEGDSLAVPSTEFIAETGISILTMESNDGQQLPDGTGVDWERSFIATPLRIRNKTIGFLNVHSSKSCAFNQETIQQIEALAAHATLAVHNATLFNELKEALENEQATRAQLVQAQNLSAIGRMVASVAHELNNPLQTINNCLFLIQQDIDEEVEAKTYIDMAFSESKRLSNLVLQLREVYRPGGIGVEMLESEAKDEMEENNGDDDDPLSMDELQWESKHLPDSSDEKQHVSLNKLVDGVHSLLEQRLKQSNIVWQQSLEHENVIVNVDANQLKQVFLNICLNGVEAILPDEGTLSIQLFIDPETEEVGLFIQDSGPGIPPDNLTQVFEPFFTTKETGSGLGLAICYEIIQSHGGRIEAKSKLDQGATFIIWLPIVSSESVAMQEA